MINRIKDRIIYQDPSGTLTGYEIERRKYQQSERDRYIKANNLIPSTSGPPSHTYGSHLPTMEDDEEEGSKKKKEKGVWYVPWYEDEDKLNESEIDMLALRSMDQVLSSLVDPQFKWDTEDKKGRKSRNNFTSYIQKVGVSSWRQRKSIEDTSIMAGVTKIAMSGATKIYSKGDGNSSAGSIGGPPNSANVFGTSGRGGRGMHRGGRGG